jgi:hypothetical protein
MMMCRWAGWIGRAVKYRPGRPAASHASQVQARLLPRTLALAAVAVIALTAAAPAASPGPANMMGIGGKFGLAPVQSGHGKPSLYFQLTVAPGRSARAAIIVANLGNKPQKLKIGRSIGITAANGGSTYRPLSQGCAGPGCWVMGLPRVVTLAAGAQESLNFTVRVPAFTSPGQYLGGISAGPYTKPASVLLGRSKKASTHATIVQDVTIGVAVTVGRLSSLTTTPGRRSRTPLARRPARQVAASTRTRSMSAPSCLAIKPGSPSTPLACRKGRPCPARSR